MIYLSDYLYYCFQKQIHKSMKITDFNNIATISDEFPTITSWVVDGKNILFPEQELKIDDKLKKRGGIPICFPNFGISVDYKEVKIPQHGYLRDTEKLLPDALVKKNSVIMSGTAAAYGLSYFTSLEVKVNYLFNNPTLTQILSVKSGIPSQMMPLGLGFHPYFKVNRKYLNLIRDGKQINRDFYSDSKCIRAQKIDFYNVFEIQIDEKMSVVMKCSGAFQTELLHAFIWSDSPDQYICVEPVMVDTKLFGTPNGHFIGDETEYYHVSYTLRTW